MNIQKVAICLSTYNGAEYLSEQMDSLLVQTCQNWTLWIRDDRSTDNTLSIVQDYIKRCPRKIILITDTLGQLGPALSFGRLLEAADGDYFMFCDQDDVWMPDKVEQTLKTMKKAESDYSDKPILVHSDLTVVDSKLNIIAKSLWTYQKLLPSIGDDVGKIIIKNVVTGCAMMINRKAKEVSIPIPQEAVMHDWWIAIQTAYHGKIIPLPTPLMYYRQHQHNRLGAWQEDVFHVLKKIKYAPAILSHHHKMARLFEPGISNLSVLFRMVKIKLLQLTRTR